MWPNPQFPADLVTFTEEKLNGKLLFLCSGSWSKHSMRRFVVCFLSIFDGYSQKFCFKRLETWPKFRYVFRSQQTFTCSRSSIESLEKVGKMLAVKTSKRRHWCRSCIFVVNFELISYVFPVFLLLTLSKYLFAGVFLKRLN